jgi:hypothetical protein
VSLVASGAKVPLSTDCNDADAAIPAAQAR